MLKESSMKKVAVIGCGSYMNSGYGCPGEWRCIKSANLGEGHFTEPHQVVGLITCECPGRSVVPTVGMMMRLSEIRPDVIHLSSCMVNAQPGCPYFKAEELAAIIKEKTGIQVVLRTHDYH
jgi:predicted metal-binding protein